MSGICGWWGARGEEGRAAEVLSRMTTALAPGDPEGLSCVAPLVAVAAVALHGNARVRQEGGLLVAVAGRPHFPRADLAAISASHGAAAALSRGFAEKGRDVLALVQGQFALAIAREDGTEALVATDRTGCFPLYYWERGESVVFASSPLAVEAHPSATSDLSPQAIYDYFHYCQVPAPLSIRRGQARLLPGEYLHLRGGTLARGTYHRTSYHPQKSPLLARKEEFRRLLRAAVERRVGQGSVGAFLSGGTDSSTVAGTLTSILGRPARTYSIGFAAEGYDEMDYARTAAKHFGTDHHEYYVTPEDVLEAIPAIAAAHGNPFANESAVPTYFCARLAARDGVQCMMAGDGGDEIFGGNERYASQKIFEFYGHVPRVIRAVLEPIVAHFPLGQRILPVRKARGYIRYAKTRLPDRLGSHGLLRVLGPDRIFEPAFLASVDQDEPTRLARSVYDSADADETLNRLLALDLKFTLADNDLPKVNRSCELAGVEVAYPFLDDDLVAFAARLPVELKVKGFKLRWFFKWALADFLPAKILTKKKHGFGLPFGVWLRTHAPLQELARQSLHDLSRRGIVRPAFMDEILELHRTGHAGFYGVMIWMLLMLEQWFKVHGEEPARIR